jgi:putative membrane protein (TIGR04086 family)
MVKRTTHAVKSRVIENFGFFSLLKGTVYAYVITIPFFIFFALILTYMDFPEKYIVLAVMITTIGSILFASRMLARSIKKKAWFNGGLIGFFYMLLLYLVSSIVFKDFSLDRYVLIMVLIGVLAGAIGGILGAGFEKKTKPRKWKRK